jgi:hypothetical protein
MKTILILSLLFLRQLHGETLLSRIDIDKKVQDTLLASGSYDSDLSWITNANRPMVFQSLLDKIDKIKNQYPAETTTYEEDALVRIGHEETTKRLVETLANPHRTRRCIYTATEIIIPYAIWWVYNGSTENPNKPGWDVIRNSVRENAMWVIVGNISIGKNFPQATRQWAEKLAVGPYDKMGSDACVALVKSWWEHNQTAILEKRYADATWLPLYKGKPAVLDEAEIAEREMDKQRGKFPWFAIGATYGETIKSNLWHWLGLGTLVCLAMWRLLCWNLTRKKARFH